MTHKHHRSGIALGLLAASGAAQAQSTVTVYGKLDMGVRKASPWPRSRWRRTRWNPFGGNTVAQVRDAAMRVGGMTSVRVDDSARHGHSANGLTGAVPVGEAGGLGIRPNSRRRATRVPYAAPYAGACGSFSASATCLRYWNTCAEEYFSRSPGGSSAA